MSEENVPVSAFVRTWSTIMLTMVLLCVQFYTGHLILGLVSLTITIGFGISPFLTDMATDTPVTRAQLAAAFISRIMVPLWAVWMVINFPLVFPLLVMLFYAPLLIKVLFLLFIGTTALSLFLYATLETGRKKRDIMTQIAQADELSVQAHVMLSQAQEKGMNTSGCEEILERAGEFIILAQKCLGGKDYINADVCASTGVDMYEEAIRLIASLG